MGFCSALTTQTTKTHGSKRLPPASAVWILRIVASTHRGQRRRLGAMGAGGVCPEDVVTTSEAQYTSIDLTNFCFTLMRGLSASA